MYLYEIARTLAAEQHRAAIERAWQEGYASRLRALHRAQRRERRAERRMFRALSEITELRRALELEP
jgi:hypothetical protein